MEPIYLGRDGRRQTQTRTNYLQLAALNPDSRTWDPSSNPDVFISYTLQDAQHMENLARSCLLAGLSVYADVMDPKVLGDSPMLGRYLKGQIQRSKSLVVIWTNNTPQSNWVQWEVGAAYDEKPIWTYTPTVVTTLPSYLESDSIRRGHFPSFIADGIKSTLR